ncbi:hemolysin D [Novimethylophilus kurashikiensis]|uniref:Hemolysin D n=1 Tax=Novimethylophilus kurashikiensis TaxID=1825523 RepID=A0A2R5F5D0_9PROT|nr:hypothetical protein [Novimethylophilus kurashikiensis]GBG13552.1 hemolysin D [Novimethylophilus kurashikiensis]
MSDYPTQRDDERFQQVLGRLDALVRRGQGDEMPPPPPPAVSEATIPVLTEVYQPEESEQLRPHGEQSLLHEVEAVVLDAVPEMAKMLADAVESQVKPTVNQVLDAVIAEMRPQIEEKIRQRLMQALANHCG